MISRITSSETTAFDILYVVDKHNKAESTSFIIIVLFNDTIRIIKYVNMQTIIIPTPYNGYIFICFFICTCPTAKPLLVWMMVALPLFAQPIYERLSR